MSTGYQPISTGIDESSAPQGGSALSTRIIPEEAITSRHLDAEEHSLVKACQAKALELMSILDHADYPEQATEIHFKLHDLYVFLDNFKAKGWVK